VGEVLAARDGRLDRIRRAVLTEPAQSVGAPRTSRVRAILAVVAGLLITGVLTGGVWALIAPPIHAVVALTHSGERVRDYLGDEADNLFVAASLMFGLLTLVALTAPVLVWQWRAHRGPGMVLGLSAGMVAAAAAAASVGALLVRLRYGAMDIDRAPVTHKDPFHYFAEAPPVLFGHTPLQVTCTVLVPAAAAALVYALLAAASPRDDLGSHPLVDAVYPPVPVTMSQAAPPSEAH
jgi:Protein of unknown function (DUF2567)